MWLEISIFVGAIIAVLLLLFWKRKDNNEPSYYSVNNFVDWEDMEKQIYFELNLQRQLFKEEEALPDMNLRYSAEQRALHYSKLGEVKDHKGWDKIATSLKEKGIKSPAEILGWGYFGADGVVKAWIKSDDHRPILLSGRRNLVGVGFVKKGIKTYFVCHFGR